MFLCCKKLFKFIIGYTGNMTKTIQAAFSPLLIVGSLCGWCFFEYPLGRIRPYLSSLYFLIAWSLYGYLLYYFIPISERKNTFLHWNSIITKIATIMSMLVNLFHFKELKMCLHKLSILDDTLEVLEMSKEYRRLHNYIIRLIIGWILLICFTDTVDFFTWDNINVSTIEQICVVFLANYMGHVNTVSGMIWGTTLRHIHLQLCRISRELNKVFSMQMTLEMALFFRILVQVFIEFYDIYAGDDVNTLHNVMMSIVLYMFAVINIVKLFVLNYICQTVCDKANETIAILYKMLNNSVNEDLREQILQFILQIKQREVKFSGMGLFYFGNSFVRKFFMSIMTVVVIIIQMRTPHARNDTSNQTISTTVGY